MKRNYFLPVLLVLGMYLFLSCEMEEDKMPSACFTASKTSAMVGDSISFSNCSSDATLYGWNFGDGTTSPELAPTHQYESSGNYSVTLTAYNKDKANQFSLNIDIEDENTVACIESSTSRAELGQTINFTNCSSGAYSYLWEFDDGYTSSEISPSHSYDDIGNYTVKLTAYGDNGNDEATYKITVDDGSTSFDPRVYGSSPTNGWSKYYGNDFSQSGEWTEETTENYIAEISDGYYSIENLTTEYSWSFFAGEALPAESENYDIDVFCNLVYDEVTLGVGMVWAYNLDDSEYYYYRYTDYESQIWSIIGNSIDGSWLPDDWGLLGGNNDENLLTVRKYDGNYYFFMNQEFVYEHSYGGDYGDEFGFFVGASSEMSINEITIHNMDFGSRKTNSEKTYNSTTETNRVGGSLKSKLENTKAY